ncbi:MAG: hypothetical protein R3284_06660, partial [Rubricoccaceae bacterium]|nr:hypothetical protein [Rubricoccaceae bacterium]
MKRFFNYLTSLVVATLLFAGGLAQAQENPPDYTDINPITCNWLYTIGLLDVDPEYGIVSGDPFPFGVTQNFTPYGVPTSLEITMSEGGNPTLADWDITSGAELLAVIVGADENSGVLWNAYVYDPAETSDDRVHNGGDFEADATDIHFMKFCFAPAEPPGEGCTLTQGYWKTHSERGPAPYDDTWNQLEGDDGVANSGDDGSTEDFFDTPLDWYEMFHTPPSGGNKYISLAHQWMAAYLNGLAGADLSEVASEMATAAGLLDDYDAFWNDPRGYPNAIRNQMNSLANTLDAYNNGDIGPGHCDDGEGDLLGENASLTGDPQTFLRTPAYPNPFN